MPSVTSAPFLLVFGSCFLAAAAAALGPVFLEGGPGTRNLRVGFSYGLASGLMLGAGHLLMLQGLSGDSSIAVAGAVAGVAFTFVVRRLAGLEREQDPADSQASMKGARRLLLQQSLHSWSEGVAIGVFFLVSLELGLLVATALAFHNIAEAVLLSETLEGAGFGRKRSALLAVLSNASQLLMAVTVFAAGEYLQGVFAGLLGFSAAVMIFLVLTELLPAGYRRSARPLLAALVCFSAWAMLLLEALLL